MFDSLPELSQKLAKTGYFIDPVMTQVVFLAAKLNKPLLLEGPAGSGKTQLAVSVAAAAGSFYYLVGVWPLLFFSSSLPLLSGSRLKNTPPSHLKRNRSKKPNPQRAA